MNDKALLEHAVSALLEAGMEKSQGFIVRLEKHEMNIEIDRIKLLRTTFETVLALSGIISGRKGMIIINKSDPASIQSAVEDVAALANSSSSDPAHDIAERQPPREFSSGPEAVKKDLMYERFSDFLAHCKNNYPSIRFDHAVLDFTTSKVHFLNSNGVDFSARQGKYSFSALFSAKEGRNTSSFNHTSFSTRELDLPIREYASVETLLKQTCEQINPENLPENFEGDLIVTPDCLKGFLISYISTYLGDRSIITGTSIFKDSLGKQIADPALTVRSCPLSPELADLTFFTKDGYESRDFAFIEKGILKNFALSLYGSNKTGKARAPNDAFSLFVDSGSLSHAELVKKVKRGILLCRFSGGSPGESGDFSGVAKNSYYIENGEIRFPLKETMISGNLVAMFNNIAGISSDTINYGSDVLPWVHSRGISVTGK